jgi:adenylate kinase
VSEAQVLESALSFYKRLSLTIINLDTPEEIVRIRMEGRARPDDTQESIEARLQWYREETVPVLAYYRGRPQTNVYDINGTASIDEVYADIMKHLGILA